MANAATQLITKTYQQPYRLLKRTADKETRTVDDRADSYSEFISALARKFTNSNEEAEAAVREMNADIQRCQEKGVIARSNEDRLVARIAWRRLLKLLQ